MCKHKNNIITIKKYTTSVFLLLHVIVLSAQTTFQKLLPLELTQTLIEKSIDHETVFIAGVVNSSGKKKIEVLKVETNTGNIIWRKIYDSNFSIPFLRDMVVQKDGVVLAVSDETPSQSNAFLSKFDSDGNLVWTRQIGKKNKTQLFDIEEDDKNRIWISGLEIPTLDTDTAAFFITQMHADGQFSKAIKIQYRLWMYHITDDLHKVYKLTWVPELKKMFASLDNSSPHAIAGIYKDLSGGLSTFVSPNEYIAQFDSLNFMDVTAMFANIQSMKKSSEGRLLMAFKSKNYITNDTFNCISYFDVKSGFFNDIKCTQKPIKIIGTYEENAYAYLTEENVIVKLDKELNTIWKIKIDRCQQTTYFNANVLKDGSVFTVRNIKNKTLKAKISAEGTLSNCSTSDMEKTNLDKLDSYKPFNIGGKILSYSTNLDVNGHNFQVENKEVEIKDYCLKADATFYLPDTVCLGDTLLPSAVDTSTLISHIWQTPNKGFDDPIPSIYFDKKGIVKIKHLVKLAECQDSSSRIINVVQKPDIKFNNTIICLKDSLTIDLKDENATAYFINNQSTVAKITLSIPGEYSIKVKAGGCEANSLINVKIKDFVPPEIIQDSLICNDEPFLAFLTDTFLNVVWDNNIRQDTFVINDDLQHTFKGTYKSDNDCVFEGVFKVEHKECNNEKLYTANVISPDKINNGIFQPIPKPNITILSMKIFDKWGNVVFHSKENNPVWDGYFKGSLSSQGVYLYFIEYMDKISNKIEFKTGDVLLMR